MSVTDASFPIINWSKAMPSLRQLMYFACVAEYGSIGQAAEVLHVSQPSLSRQIQALEVHIGEALFVRGPAGVSLTEVGRVVHCRAVKIIAEAKALTRDIGDGDDRQLHIGFSRYLDPGWSGKLARQLKEARVCSAVSPSWAPSLDLLSLVRESSLDAAIIGAPPKVVREYELMEIGSYEHVIALSETLHRRLAPDWSLNDLVGEPLLIHDRLPLAERRERVAALLELGMGFHPDFTGRQNVFMAGQLLGMQVEEIQALMPDIEAFAEIGEAIEQPVRTYSSGMQMRLAFSVATARRPDILIVDEALSVGDAYFQHKSFERIRSFRKAGTTLLIVSHDRSAIQSICDSAILLEQGRMAMRGRPEEVMDYYNALLAEREGQTVRQEMLADGQVRTISGTGEAAILDVRMVDQRQRVLEVVEVGQAVTLEVEVEVRPVSYTHLTLPTKA